MRTTSKPKCLFCDSTIKYKHHKKRLVVHSFPTFSIVMSRLHLDTTRGYFGTGFATPKYAIYNHKFYLLNVVYRSLQSETELVSDNRHPVRLVLDGSLFHRNSSTLFGTSCTDEPRGRPKRELLFRPLF